MGGGRGHSFVLLGAVAGILLLTPGAAVPGELPTVRVRLYEGPGPVLLGAQRSGAPGLRVERGAGGLRVNGQPVGAHHRLAGGGPFRVVGLRVRGDIELRQRGNAVLVVNELSLEDYLAGTLLREMSPSWEEQALRVQAVVSRTYALHRIREGRGRPFDLDATTRSQVYGGMDAESALSRRVARATRGEYLAGAEGPILAAYHSASGGRTASAEEVWGEPVAYLVSQPVAGEEDSPESYWRLTVRGPALGEALEGIGIGVGPVRELRVVRRASSGRVDRLRLEGARGRAEITGRELRSALGETHLRSTLFRVRREEERFVFVGSGYGHGVGLSQWGARALAAGGMDYRTIVTRFYPGTRLQRLGNLGTVAAGGAQ